MTSKGLRYQLSPPLLTEDSRHVVRTPSTHHDYYDHLNARRIRTSRRDPRNNDHRVVCLQHSHQASCIMLRASVQLTKSRGDFRVGAFDDIQ